MKDVNGWFGLTYASYLVLPRCLMKAMPATWQEKMVALLEEAGETFEPENDNYTVLLRGDDGRIAKDPLREYRYPPPLPWRNTPPPAENKDDADGT